MRCAVPRFEEVQTSRWHSLSSVLRDPILLIKTLNSTCKSAQQMDWRDHFNAQTSLSASGAPHKVGNHVRRLSCVSTAKKDVTTGPLRFELTAVTRCTGLPAGLNSSSLLAEIEASESASFIAFPD